MNQQGKLIITGASGFTGQHACAHFLKSGFDITAVSRKKINFEKEIHTECCDLTNKKDVYSLVKSIKPHFLLHLAGQNHVGESWLDPVSSLEANSMSTAYLIDALRKESPTCKILIVGSALQFDPTSISTLSHPYSLSKTLQVLIAQSWAVLYNMDIVIAKPSNLIGPGFSKGVCSVFAQKIVEMEEQKAEKVLEVHNLNAKRDFLDVRDAVRAYEVLLKKGKSGEIYDVASGNNCTLGEIIEGYKLLTSEEIQVKLKRNDLIEKNIESDPIKLVNLGWKQRIPLESSLLAILNFYRRQK
ncbi:NAD-dependent epimerase/dehydratase family protein [Peribacillus frigoritolerans]|uniref:NAD-dependent epimerase/dehydratase family protein n=1 Tax=Peribacillus frigoritolerans TaxID=450367 RepID=UPI0007BF777B|nr:NAD-dependent epimerase/dehydratase family protein [Peribacillus frigoritolerans]MCR8868165.1 NAD-dependent epimerase/dehydratase family protein [Peribacillus frigoritolerans]WHY11895.1 NAD-dependent epimerase/dehydratase family protein [Peribacillus frigoritolerans]